MKCKNIGQAWYIKSLDRTIPVLQYTPPCRVCRFTRVNNADAMFTRPALVSGLRSLGNQTPILNSWAGDGTYWLTKDPQVTNYYAVTYASVFGDDPNKAVRALAAKLHAFTGGFLAGSAADIMRTLDSSFLGASGSSSAVQQTLDSSFIGTGGSIPARTPTWPRIPRNRDRLPRTASRRARWRARERIQAA